jgi:hypothetical protein
MAPKPRFFLLRPNPNHATRPTTEPPATIVPLIAVDELPDWLEIVGAPRELAVEQTAGMEGVGVFRREEEEGRYAVRVNRDVLAGGGRVSSGRRAHQGDKQVVCVKQQKNKKSKEEEEEETVVAYCRVWCRRGVCKWGEECRFARMLSIPLSSFSIWEGGGWSCW